MFADDVASGRAEDIADKKNIHLKSLHGEEVRFLRWVRLERRNDGMRAAYVARVW